MPPYYQTAFDDVEMLQDSFSHRFDGEVHQLTGGNLGQSECLELSGVYLHLFQHQAATRTQEVSHCSGVAFGAVFSADTAPRWMGEELQFGHIVAECTNEAVDYILPQNATGFLIEIDTPLSEQLLPYISPDRKMHATPKSFSHLWQQLNATMQTARDAKTQTTTALSPAATRDSVLRQLLACLQQTQTGDAHRQTLNHAQRIVAQAEHWLLNRPNGKSIIIPEVADQMRISERTLERAFKQATGLSPLRYFKVLRLHQFRKQLLQHGKHYGQISLSAAKHGFTHHSHLAKDYKQLFGETPKQTIARHRSYRRSLEPEDRI